MKKQLFLTLMLLMTCVWASAQYWESGTMKTNTFYSYSSGNSTVSKTEVWYDINAESDGKMEFGSTALGAVRIDAITLYAVVDNELIFMGSGSDMLVVDNVAAGLYRVKINGGPTDRDGRGGNFVVSYVLNVAEYVNDPEPNDTWERAYLIRSGSLQHGHLGYKRGNYQDTKDWYKIEVPDEGTITFTTHTSTKLRLGSLHIYAPNEDGTDLLFRTSKDMDGHNMDTTIVFAVPDVAPGTYYIRLDHWLGYGSYEMKYSFTANSKEPDAADNDTWRKALFLPFDTPQEGRLGYSYRELDTQDWYVIDVRVEGKLTFTTKTDVTLRLGSLTMYTPNSEGSEMLFRNNKDMDGANKDTTIVYEVPDVSIGRYYIRLDRWQGYGGYELTCYFTSHADEADPEPNNDWNQAIALKSGPAITGQLGYNYNNDTDTKDWYVIDVPKEGAAVFSTTTETTIRLGSLHIYSPNEDGSDLLFRASMDMDGYNKDTTIVFTAPDLAPGTYYIRLDRWQGYGTYKLQYVFNPNTHQNDPEPNDEWAQGSGIESETTQEGCLGYRYQNYTDANDWFRIDVPDEGALNFATTTETTLRLGSLNVFCLNADGSGVEYRTSKDMDGANQDTTIVFVVPDVAPGTYYIRLDRWLGYGGYKLDYSFTANRHDADYADNNAWNAASLIENKTTQQGRLGYSYRDTDLHDWYKIVLDDEGSVTFKSTTDVTLRLGSLNVYVPKEDGTSLIYRGSKDMDGHNMDTTIVYTIPDMAPGTYYIRLDRWQGYGGYDMQYVFTPDIYGQDSPYNDTVDGATIIESGSTQQGRLGYTYRETDRHDWFRIDVPQDGAASFALSAEPTLRAGSLNIYLPEEEGTGLSYRSSKDMDGVNKDTTIVFGVNDLAAGTYYIRLDHWQGYGGYAMKYEFIPNSYDREHQNNIDFANRIQLEKGQTLTTTLGYQYHKTNSQDWYDLGELNGQQIDITIVPDSSRSLTIGVVDLYRYEGNNDKGNPLLTPVASARLERSKGTISYIDTETTPSHYIVMVPRYSGYGGYSITFEGDQEEEGAVELANTNVKVMTGGRNTVRKGVPCENPITISNLSNLPSDFFLLAVLPTENVNIIGFYMPTGGGIQYIPADSVTVPGEDMCLFVVPKLLPWESYTFTMISEGKGDIAYAPEKIVYDASRRVVILGTAVTVAAIGAFAKTAVVGLATGFAIDWVSKKAGDAIFPADSQAATEYANLMGTTKDQLGIRSSWDSPTVYTAKSFVSTCTTEATKKIVPKTGTILDVAGNTITALQNIIPNLRRRIWYWIYKDLGYFDNNSLDVLDGKQAITDVVASWDPNEMVGPQGVGDEHFIGETKTITYRILFENKAEAGDAAYRVRVSDELDENIFDISSVRFGETSHDGVGYNWEMTREGNKLTWDIKGIELPPNVNAPEGEGFVSFSVDLKPNLANGTQIKNKATIIFDKNFPIETNEFVNTLDLVPPTTSMSKATFNEKADTINVICKSEDEGAGVNSYLFFVSKNGEDYAYCGQSVTGNFAFPVIDGTTEDTFSFYVLASDNVGNMERVVPTAIDADTGIKDIRIVDDPNATLKVYTVDGRFVGDTLSGLAKGVYVVGGKKLIIK